MPFEEYKDLVATAAGITTIAQFFSPVLVCKKIVENGHTKGMDPMPFIGGLGLTILFLQYGIILNDPAMIPVNVFGFVLNLGYAICFYRYTSEKTEFMTSLGRVAALTAVLIGYANWEHPDNVEFRFGMIVTLLMFCLIGAPLFSLGDIIEKKSVEGLPFPMILSGTVVTSLWFLYAIIINNTFMQVQNVVGLVLSAIQLSLFAIYPSSPPKKDTEKKEK